MPTKRDHLGLPKNPPIEDILPSEILYSILESIWISSGDFETLSKMQLVNKHFRTLASQVLSTNVKRCWNSRKWQVKYVGSVEHLKDAWFEGIIEDFGQGENQEKTVAVKLHDCLDIIHVPRRKEFIRLRPDYVPLFEDSERAWTPRPGQLVEVQCFLEIENISPGWYSCDSCDAVIRGPRIHCMDCGVFDENYFDLCEACDEDSEARKKHPKEHRFIRYPDSDFNMLAWYEAIVTKVHKSKVEVEYVNSWWQTQKKIGDDDPNTKIVIAKSLVAEEVDGADIEIG